MNEGMSEAMEVTYTKGQMNGDHPTQDEIVTSTMVWELGKLSTLGQPGQLWTNNSVLTLH